MTVVLSSTIKLLVLSNVSIVVLLGICKGKKNYDKRESIKEKDIKREIQKSLKNK